MSKVKTKKAKKTVIQTVVETVLKLANDFIKSCQRVFVGSIENIVRHDEWNTRSRDEYNTSEIKSKIYANGFVPADMQFMAYRDENDSEVLHLLRGHRGHCAFMEIKADDPGFYDSVIAPTLFINVCDYIADPDVRQVIINDHSAAKSLSKGDVLEEIRAHVLATGQASIGTIRHLYNLISSTFDLRLSDASRNVLITARAALEVEQSSKLRIVIQDQIDNVYINAYKGKIDPIVDAARMTDSVWMAYKAGILSTEPPEGFILKKPQINILKKIWKAEREDASVMCTREEPSEKFLEAFNAQVDVSADKDKAAKQQKALNASRPKAKTKDFVKDLMSNLPKGCEALRDTVYHLMGILLDKDDPLSLPENRLSEVTTQLK